MILPANATEVFYAALPFAEAQGKLSETPPRPRSATRLVASWHTTGLDPQLGSFMVVNSTKPELAYLIGERVKVTFEPTVTSPMVVYAYVHNALDLDDDDVSLTRHLYARLALLSRPMISVKVEPLQGS